MGRTKIIILIIGIVLTILFTSVFDACSSPAATEDANKTHEVAVSQLSGKVDKYNMTEAEKKMSTDLLDLIKATEPQSSSEPTGISNGFQSSNFVSADPANPANEELVYVYVYLNDGTNIEVIQPFVQEITDQDEENGVAVVWVAVNGLEELASLEVVKTIRTVVPPVTNLGSVTTEGDFVHGTASARSNYSQDGSGMKIGVISDGVDHLADPQASGDLPADVTVLSNTYEGDEGTAMLEIIHDMMPGAKLYFHDCGDNTVAFNSAIDKLVAAGCNIIVDDIGWRDQPYFEDGIVAKHVAEMIENYNIVYVSAAGNSALQHYQKKFESSKDDINIHNDKIPLYIPDGEQIVLQWDDSFGSSSNNYDLYLYDENNILIDRGYKIQDGNDEPFEYVTNHGEGVRYITIKKAADAETKTLELECGENSLILDSTYITAADSIYGHPAVPDVIAVGAISAFDENYDEIESYSSQGPVTITYPTASQRQKPDICGVDKVNITGAGNFGEPYNNNWYFGGTSAAAPHVAAVAAQIWGSNPSMTAAEVRNVLLSYAVDDRGVIGYDTVYGHGIANSSKYFMGIATTQDKNKLIAAIKEATEKVEASIAGTEDGQYPQDAIDAFKAAVAAARTVADDKDATYAEVNRAITELKEAEAVFDGARIVTVDQMPPASVADLMESGVGPNWIRWQWKNPKDLDFNHVMIYLDKAFVTNTTDSYYNATALADGVTYNIGIETVDASGNINSLRVSDSATTVRFPRIFDVSGTNITAASITLVWEASDETARVGIYRNNVRIGDARGSTSYVDSSLDSDTTYIYTLIPYNREGLAGKEVSISLKTRSSGSGSSENAGSSGDGGSSSEGSSSAADSGRQKKSSGGGGGGGPTGDRYENVLLKEAQSTFVSKDSKINYSFRSEGNKITSIQFMSLKTSGNIQATIEVLKDKSSFAKSNAPGKIYQQMNIWVGKIGFVVPENVKDLKIGFKVDKSWLQENKIETSTVNLYRYADSSWNALPTSVTAEDEGYVYFESSTPGFSPFAISSEAENTEVVDESVLKSVNEEDTGMDSVENEKQDVMKHTSQIGFILVVLVGITVVLAGAYIVYRKRS